MSLLDGGWLCVGVVYVCECLCWMVGGCVWCMCVYVRMCMCVVHVCGCVCLSVYECLCDCCGT